MNRNVVSLPRAQRRKVSPSYIRAFSRMKKITHPATLQNFQICDTYVSHSAEPSAENKSDSVALDTRFQVCRRLRKVAREEENARSSRSSVFTGICTFSRVPITTLVQVINAVTNRHLGARSRMYLPLVLLSLSSQSSYASCKARKEVLY